MSLTKKQLVIITGGSNGIGQELAKQYYLKGFQVVVIDKESSESQESSLKYYFCDLSDSDQIEKVFEKIKDEFGYANVLINNAAISMFNKPIHETIKSEIDLIYDVNLKAAYWCSKKFVKLNKEEKYGRIINIASTRFNQNEKDWELYGSTKGGLVALTSSLAISLSDYSITVNAISPGYIKTKNYEELTLQEHLVHPSRRVGKPVDIFKACWYLCDPENDFVNGHNLIVDGGMSKKMNYED